MADYEPKSMCRTTPPATRHPEDYAPSLQSLQPRGNAERCEELRAAQGTGGLSATAVIGNGTAGYTLGAQAGGMIRATEATQSATGAATLGGKMLGHTSSVAHNLTAKGKTTPPAALAKPAKPRRGRASGPGKNKRNRIEQRNWDKAQRQKAARRAKQGAPRSGAAARQARAASSSGKSGPSGASFGDYFSGALNILGGIASGYDTAVNSEHDGVRAGADGVINGGLNTLANFTPAGLATAAETIFASKPEDRNVSGLLTATSGMLASIGDGAGASRQIDANRAGKRGTFVQTLTERGDVAGDCMSAVGDFFGGDNLFATMAAWGAAPACLVPNAALGTVEGLGNAGLHLAESAIDSITAEPQLSRDELEAYARWNEEVACPMQGCHARTELPYQERWDGWSGEGVPVEKGFPSLILPEGEYGSLLGGSSTP